MQRRVFKQAALIGPAFLGMVLSGTLADAALRDNAVAYRTQGYDAQQRDDRLGALSWYQKAVTLDPSYADPHNDMGIVLEEEGRIEEARQAYEHALALDPNFLEAHSNLALLAERRGDKEQAVSHWLKRYQLGQPTDPWTIQAQEHLRALGALIDSPRPVVPAMPLASAEKTNVLTSPIGPVRQEFNAHEQSRAAFYAVTEEQDHWSARKTRGNR